MRMDKFQRFLSQHMPSIVLVQEPCAHTQNADIAIDGYTFVEGNTNVSAYVSQAWSLAGVASLVSDRWLTVDLGNTQLHNLYFPADSSAARSRFLETLIASTSADGDSQHIFCGDFNLAPRECDGLYGGEVSRFTSKKERRLLDEFCQKLGLVDLFVAHNRYIEFTYEKMNQGKLTQFRCDLCLVSRGLARKLSIETFHKTRSGEQAFTDHSALLVSCSTRS